MNFISSNATSWIWSFPGGIPSSSTAQNPQHIYYFTPGKYDVSLIATSYKGSSKITLTNFISVVDAPVGPHIKPLQHDTLYCTTDTSYISYQWLHDTTLLVGKTDTFLVITQAGDYYVRVTNRNGCSIAVGIIGVGFNEFTSDGLQFMVIPNPAGDEITITGNPKLEIGNWKLDIYNLLGEAVFRKQLQSKNSKLETINVSSLPPGIYFLQVYNETGKWNGRFVKE